MYWIDFVACCCKYGIGSLPVVTRKAGDTWQLPAARVRVGARQ